MTDKTIVRKVVLFIATSVHMKINSGKFLN